MRYDDLLGRFVQITRDALGENLTGVYLHGSLAMGCFNPRKSDLDLIVVVRDALSDAAKIDYLAQIVALNDDAPPKGIEMSVVRAAYCSPFVYPTPYEFHFSHTWLSLAREDPQAYVKKICGTDRDLAAHFTIINRYGAALYGKPVAEVFAPVPCADYWDSIWCDVENAAQDIGENPLYVALNLCRVLAYAREGAVLSKRAGGEWGAANLPEPYRRVAQAALACYTDDAPRQIDEAAAADYAQYMITQIRNAGGL